MAKVKTLSEQDKLKGKAAEALLVGSKRGRRLTAKRIAAQKADDNKRKSKKSKQTRTKKQESSVKDLDICKICDGRCVENSDNTSIECTKCKSWYHNNCVCMTERELILFETAPINYHCIFCLIQNINNETCPKNINSCIIT